MRIIIEIDDDMTLQKEHEQFLTEWLECARYDDDGGVSALMALLEVAGNIADEITDDE